MGLLGEVITVEQIGEAAVTELVKLWQAIHDEMERRAAAVTQAAIAAGEATINAEEAVEAARRGP